MPKTKLKKQEILRDLIAKTARSKSIVFTNFKGLTVHENEELREKLKENDSEYYVPKKTLLNLALKENKIEDVDTRKFSGSLAVIFGYNDEVASARIVDEFRKDHEEKIDFAGGILEDKFLNKDEIIALAKLPSKDELYAKIVGSLNAPVSGFVNVLAGNIRGFVNVLKAIENR